MTRKWLCALGILVRGREEAGQRRWRCARRHHLVYRDDRQPRRDWV